MKKYLLLILLLVLIPFPAQADLGLKELLGIYNLAPEEPPMDPEARERRIETLKKGIHDIDVWWRINNFHRWIHEKYCAEDFKNMKKWYEEAERLDKAHKDNPTKEYQKQLREVKEQNRMSRNWFENCVTAEIRTRNLQDLNDVGATDYTSFNAVHSKMAKRFAHKDTLSLHRKYREELEKLTEFDSDKNVIGWIESRFKTVEIKRGGKWVPAKEGMVVYIPDELRTGPRGRARIKFNDYHRPANVGPTIINISPDTHIKLIKFEVSLTEPMKRDGLIDVIKGVVRASTKNWGLRSSFSVRTGTSLCGIRGTEVAISYDPKADKVTYLLDHGDVEIKGPGKTISLSDGQRLEINKGQMGSVEKLSQSEWIEVVSKTSTQAANRLGEGANESAASSILGGIDQALSAFKYHSAKGLLKYTTGTYNEFIPEAVKTAEGLYSMPNIPVKWTPLCLGECTTQTECKVYTNIWYDEWKEGDPASPIILIARKEQGIWKLADFNSKPTETFIADHKRQMKACGH